MKKNLWKVGLAGIVAIATMGPISAQEQMPTRFRPAAAQRHAVLSEAQIHRMKAALRLTRAQEQYWPPIAAALREVAREMAHNPGADTGSIDQSKVQRLASVAYPLLASLDETQKRDGLALVRAMGFGSLIASF